MVEDDRGRLREVNLSFFFSSFFWNFRQLLFEMAYSEEMEEDQDLSVAFLPIYPPPSGIFLL